MHSDPHFQPPHFQFRCLPFGAMSAHTVYALLRLRTEVFVVEQRCVFQDMDGADADCMHLLCEGPGGQLLASARLVPAGLKYAEASIGRVVSAPSARAHKLGHPLMAEAVRQLLHLWGPQPIRIGAQAHLQHFYQRHGFVTVTDPYDEDGIAHVEMLLQPRT
jgi:ElaA protein